MPPSHRKHVPGRPCTLDMYFHTFCEKFGEKVGLDLSRESDTTTDQYISRGLIRPEGEVQMRSEMPEALEELKQLLNTYVMHRIALKTSFFIRDERKEADLLQEISRVVQLFDEHFETPMPRKPDDAYVKDLLEQTMQDVCLNLFLEKNAMEIHAQGQGGHSR
ncbi:MAG: hypothetical protein K2Q12_08380 [Rickettsiales bacterium]|nr:hypothetical protein [Rickettsiales bacterium]